MAEWIKAREFSTRFEAELVGARLEAARIPVLIKSHAAGIFGAGFQGAVPGGVELHVPRHRLGDVEALLDSDADASA